MSSPSYTSLTELRSAEFGDTVNWVNPVCLCARVQYLAEGATTITYVIQFNLKVWRSETMLMLLFHVSACYGPTGRPGACVSQVSASAVLRGQHGHPDRSAALQTNRKGNSQHAPGRRGRP